MHKKTVVELPTISSIYFLEMYNYHSNTVTQMKMKEEKEFETIHNLVKIQTMKTFSN